MPIFPSLWINLACYAPLLLGLYLPMSSVGSTSIARRATYAAPLQSNFIATKTGCYRNNIAVKELETKFGLKYRTAVGSLVYLMNAFIYLHFALHKLAKIYGMLLIMNCIFLHPKVSIRNSNLLFLCISILSSPNSLRQVQWDLQACIILHANLLRLFGSILLVMPLFFFLVNTFQ
jgi:hypothetical protein